MRPSALGLAALAALAFAAAAGVSLLWPRAADGPASGTEISSTGESLIGGPFALTDTEGRRRTEADFRGKHMLVFFGFTHCPDFCPTALYTISQALERLGGRAERLHVLFITLDPERDTPAALKNYGGNFDQRIVALTGSPADIAAAARAYRVYYSKKPLAKEGEYTIDHSAYIYLMGPDGKFVTHFRHGVAAKDLVEGLRRYF